MPIYEFVCRDCEREQEILIRGLEQPVCGGCGGQHLVKLLSIPAAHSSSDSPAGRRDQGGSGSCGAGCACHPH
jgi:putative FmdB family regulatory protein